MPLSHNGSSQLLFFVCKNTCTVRTHVQVSAKSERSPGEPMKFVDLALNDPKALSFYAEERGKLKLLSTHSCSEWKVTIQFLIHKHFIQNF